MSGGIMVLTILILFQSSFLLFLLRALALFGISYMKFGLGHNLLLLKE